MIDSSRIIEKILQKIRFYKARPYLQGAVLDFGGNDGELGKLVSGRYQVINYDHSLLTSNNYDTIACLAVLEHLSPTEVLSVFSKFKQILNPAGKIIITTPVPKAKAVLDWMARVRLIDQRNIAEHQHYWSAQEIKKLSEDCGFSIKFYQRFELGYNQLIILEHQKISS